MRPQRAKRGNQQAARPRRKRQPKARGANKLKPTVYITAVPALMPPRRQAS